MRDSLRAAAQGSAMLAIPPSDSHQPHETLSEISAILAAGLVRVLARKSSQNLPSEIDLPLDCEGNSGGDVAAEIETSRP